MHKSIAGRTGVFSGGRQHSRGPSRLSSARFCVARLGVARSGGSQPRTLRIAAALAVAAGLTASARGDTLFWDADGGTVTSPDTLDYGSGTWSTSAVNWFNVTPATPVYTGWINADTSIASIGATAAQGGKAIGTPPVGDYTLTLGEDITLTQLTVSSNMGAHNLTVTAGANPYVLNLSGASSNISNNTTTGTVFIDAPISSASATISKGNSGRVVFMRDNTYTGATSITGGVLQFNTVGSIGGTGASVTVASGGTAAAGFNTNIASTFFNRIVATSAGTLALTADNSETFDFSASGRNFTTASLGAVGTVTYSGALTPNGSTFRLGGGGGTLTYSPLITGAANLTAHGSGSGGTLNLNAANDYTGVTTLGGGTTNATVFGNGGVASSIGAASATATNLVLNGGTLAYTSTTASASTDRLFTLGTGGGTIAASGGAGFPLTFASTGSVAFTGSGARTFTLSGTNTGANTFNPLIGNGTGGNVALTKSAAGTWVIGNTGNTYAGVTTVSGGVLSVSQLANGGAASSIGASGSAATNVVIAGGTLRYTGGAVTTDRLISFGTGTASTLDSAGTGTITFTNTGAIGLNGTGTRTINLTSSNTTPGAITTSNVLSGSIGNNGANATTLVVGSGTANTSGNNRWTLGGNSTFTGNVTVGFGILTITRSEALGAGTKNIVLTAGTAGNPQLHLDGSGGPITLPNTFTLQTSNANGSVHNDAGNNIINSTITMASGGGATILYSNAGTLTVNGNISPNTTARTLNLRGASNGTINGNITDGSTTNTIVGLLKDNGAGTWTLTGTNNYTGPTTVTFGSLFVNGTHGNATAGDNYAVTGSGSSAAVLGGSGSVTLASGKTLTASSTSAANRGTLAPGSAAAALGTFTVNGGNGVVFGANSTFAVDTGAANASDLLNITGGTGNLSLATATDILDIVASATGNFIVAQYAGARTGTFDTVRLNGVTQVGVTDTVGPLTTFTSTDLVVTYDDTAKQVQLNVLAVPEPASIALAGIAAVGLLARRRRSVK